MRRLVGVAGVHGRGKMDAPHRGVLSDLASLDCHNVMIAVLV